VLEFTTTDPTSRRSFRVSCRASATGETRADDETKLAAAPHERPALRL